jgi:hypothetical protein
MSLKSFKKLLRAFRALIEKKEAEKYDDSSRERNPGGGAKPELLSIEDQLVFILFYFRNYPTQDLLGVLYGMSQPWANKWIHRLTPIVNAALGYEKELPARQAKDMDELLRRCPRLGFILDATERFIQRPKDKEEQKEKYSGKKKRHSEKYTVITNAENNKVIYLGPTTPGKRHDKKMVDEEDIHFPEGSTVWDDLGYVGYNPSGVMIIQPKKKPKGKELSENEKDENRRISQKRIFVEHSIGGTKFFHLVHDIYRNKKPGFNDLSMETATGLYNLNVSCRLAA